MIQRIVLICLILLLANCSITPSTVVSDVPVTKGKVKIDYLTDIKPILDKRCVTCHSCFNSPCQLKMSSFEGLERGLAKEGIYSYSLFAKQPTRLKIDAHDIKTWRKKGFSSVTSSTSPEGLNNSLMIKTLYHKSLHPEISGEYKPETDQLSCAKDSAALNSFLDDNPSRGMPYGFPVIEAKEYEIIAQWLAQGAQGPSLQQVKTLTTPSDKAQVAIKRWEKLLNQQDPKNIMSARYLYEHLFLAHIHFPSAGNEFYQLVRSYSEPGKPIDMIATRRPYDDPGNRFYYRFQKINSTIVNKTHIVLNMDERFYQRFLKFFIKAKWDEAPHVMDYDPVVSANPFALYQQIPARSRYQFMLDNAEYFVRTFIRGPVCKGQIALNVIHDKFWIYFIDPDYDLSVTDPDYFRQQIPNMILPIEKGSDFPLLKSLTDKYTDANQTYFQTREQQYHTAYPEGLGIDAIWAGEIPSDAPMQTIFRHFDSATIIRGAHGNLPRTMWVMDYPLFEKIYYNLVAGFDVFGNIGHQANVRKYFNLSRLEGESIFLDFMPPESRHAYFLDWYRNMDESMFAEENLSPVKTSINYKTTDYKREFAEQIVTNRLLKSTKIAFDLNYRKANEDYPLMPETLQTIEDYIQGFESLTRPGIGFVKNITSYDANLAYVRVKIPNEADVIISIVINRWHDNVAFMFDEKSRLNPTKDTADFIKGFVGSYPNGLIVVEEKELNDFMKLLKTYEDTKENQQAFVNYFIARDNPRFWEEFDWFQQRFLNSDPVNAGLFDLNRYAPPNHYSFQDIK